MDHIRVTQPQDMSHTAGLAPGTLVYVGDHRDVRTQVTLVSVSDDGIEVRDLCADGYLAPALDAERQHWINVVGLHSIDIVSQVGGLLGLHPLALEDILNSAQRPKIEHAEGYVYMLLKVPEVPDDPDQEMSEEQVAIALGSNLVLSFQERSPDLFAAVRRRLDSGRPRPRADFIACSLLDAVVDEHFVALERIGDRLERLEDQVLHDPTPLMLQRIHSLKRHLILMHRNVWPLREVVSSLVREQSPLISSDIRVYLRDVYDHGVQVLDTVETYRDMLSSVFDIYLSAQSHRLNEVMKVLTLVSTIFMPLTFLAGVYGMNFRHMPELNWPWAYPALWAVMAAIAAAMLAFFRRRGWL